MGKHNRHFRNVNGNESSRRIRGFQDPSLETSLKSPSWKLIEQSGRSMAGPAERHQTHPHHAELGEMAVFAFEEHTEQLHSPGRLEDIESPLG